MLPKSRSISNQSLKGQVYFRIIPQTIRQLSLPPHLQQSSKWVFYLEKGMQIIGKTEMFEIGAGEPQKKFNYNKNQMDFQIASEKNFTYTWGLYLEDDDGYEERMGSENFNIKDPYLKYETANNRNGYDFDLNISGFFQLKFKLFIQNTANNIMGLASKIVPETQDEVNRALAGINNKRASSPSGVLSLGLGNLLKEDRNSDRGRRRETHAVRSKVRNQNEDQEKVEGEPQNKTPGSKAAVPQVQRIEEQQDEDLSISESKIKQLESPRKQGLAEITEDKEIEDLVSPSSEQFFNGYAKKVGSFNSAAGFVEIRQKDEEAENGDTIKQIERQQDSQRKEEGEIVEQSLDINSKQEGEREANDEQGKEGGDQPSSSAPITQQIEQPLSEAPKQKPKFEWPIRKPKQEPVLQQQVPKSNMNLKKLAIVFLVVVLLIIVGSLIAPKSKEEEENVKVKGKKSKAKKSKLE